MTRERMSRQEWAAQRPSRPQLRRARTLGLNKSEIADKNRGQLEQALAVRENEVALAKFDELVKTGGLAPGVSVYRLTEPRKGPYTIKFIDRERQVIGLVRVPGAFKPWNLIRADGPPS